MLVTALRGVCAGVDRNLNRGDVAELDNESALFLIEIGAALEGRVDLEPPSERAPTSS